MIKNKKAWLRIVEAFIAVLLVAGFLLTIYSRQVPSTRGDEIIKIEESILNDITINPQNEYLRNDIANNKTDNLKIFTQQRLPRGLNFTIKICEPEDVCNMDSYKADIYASERVIFQEDTPKKVKLFVWQN